MEGEGERANQRAFASIVQEQDLRYLVETIWNGRSALSLVDDLHELACVRWDRGQHWSPWNCLLVTKEEASIHSTVEKLEEVCVKGHLLMLSWLKFTLLHLLLASFNLMQWQHHCDAMAPSLGWNDDITVMQ